MDEVELSNVSHMNCTTGREILVFHKVRRKFLSLDEIESEKAEDIEIYEFSDQNFKLVVK